jgi:hypothetical protein
MAAKRVVHSIGIGTIEEPLIGLFLTCVSSSHSMR